jgi:hypothetical protein
LSTDSETVVLVGDADLSPDALHRVREQETAGATIIAWQHSSIVQDRFKSPDVQTALQSAGIGSVTIAEELGAAQDFDVDEAVIAWLKAFGRDRFRGRFLFGPMELWWWAELYLYHETPLRLVVRDVEALARIVERRRPRRLVVVRPVRALGAAARKLVADVELFGDTVSGPPFRARTTRLHVADLLKLLGTGLKSLVRRPPERERARVFFLTHGSMWRGEREMYFDRILPAVRERGSATVVAFGPPVPFKKRGLSAWARDLLEIGDDALPYRPIRRYFTFPMSLALAGAFAACRRMWRRFREEAVLTHRDVALGADALACFRDTFYRQLPWAIRSYYEVESVLVTHEPEVLVLYAESSGLGRAAIAAAGAHGVPSFAVQHGIMYEQYYSHEHAAFEMGETGDDGVPVPTRTAVFGRVAKDLLVRRGHYDPERIVITGSPKFDELVRASEGFDAGATRAALGVPEGGKFLVLASRWTAVGPVFQELVEAVECADIEGGLALFVKPHQAESTAPYEAVLAETERSTARIVPASENLLELLFASDGLVTVDSFASSEALVLGRPVLVVNLPSNLDALVDRGVALGVRRGEAIEPAIRKLFDPGVAAELERTRKEYIQEFAYGADGRSTERIVEAIFDTCRSSA